MNTQNTNDTSSKVPFGLPTNCVKLYEKNGYTIFFAKQLRETGVSIRFFVVPTDKSDSSFPVIIIKSPSQLLGKNGFNFVYDLPGMLEKSDEDEIKKQYRDIESTVKLDTSPDRVPFPILYDILCSSAAVVSDTPYINLPVPDFNQIIISGDFGWTPLEVKKCLRDAGLLHRNNGRPYDYTIIEDGKPCRVISIKLNANKEDDVA